MLAIVEAKKRHTILLTHLLTHSLAYRPGEEEAQYHVLDLLPEDPLEAVRVDEEDELHGRVAAHLPTAHAAGRKRRAWAHAGAGTHARLKAAKKIMMAMLIQGLLLTLGGAHTVEFFADDTVLG